MKSSRDFPGLAANIIYTIEKLNEPCGAKDLQSRFIYANPAYYRLLDIPSNFDISGRYDSEMPASTSEFAPEFQAHDRLVETLEQRKSSLEIHEFGHERRLSAYFFDKLPMYNDAGDITGTYFYGRPAEHLSLRFYKSGSPPGSIIISVPDGMFTEKEWDVIFLIRTKHTLNETANILGVSLPAVKDRLSRVYSKTGLKGVKELMEYIRSNNWDNHIPARFITQGHMLFEA